MFHQAFSQKAFWGEEEKVHKEIKHRAGKHSMQQLANIAACQSKEFAGVSEQLRGIPQAVFLLANSVQGLRLKADGGFN